MGACLTLIGTWGWILWGLSDTTSKVQPWKNVVPELKHVAELWGAVEVSRRKIGILRRLRLCIYRHLMHTGLRSMVRRSGGMGHGGS